MMQGAKSCVSVVLTTFIWTMTAGDMLRVKMAYAAQMPMPAANQLVQLSQKYDEPTLRGVKVDPTDPFKLTFVYDKGSEGKIDEKTAADLAQYFFAALITPTKDLWVNLSPFEKDRVIEDTVAETEIGDVFLAQDYLLKQLSSSLTSPDTETGKAYWAELASKSKISNLKSENLSMNKIWITPGEIKVYSDKTHTIIADAKLDVQTEHDYFAAKASSVGVHRNVLLQGTDTTPAAVQAVRDVVLPLVKKDANEGKNFAALRQMMHAIVLAQLFKSKYGASIYGVLIDSGKDKGLETGDPTMKGDVFEKYTDSFQNGVYRSTAKMTDAFGRKTKREYFCGGVSSVLKDVTSVSAATVKTDNTVALMFDVSDHAQGTAGSAIVVGGGKSESSASNPYAILRAIDAARESTDPQVKKLIAAFDDLESAVSPEDVEAAIGGLLTSVDVLVSASAVGNEAVVSFIKALTAMVHRAQKDMRQDIFAERVAFGAAVAVVVVLTLALYAHVNNLKIEDSAIDVMRISAGMAMLAGVAAAYRLRKVSRAQYAYESVRDAALAQATSVADFSQIALISGDYGMLNDDADAILDQAKKVLVADDFMMFERALQKGSKLGFDDFIQTSPDVQTRKIVVTYEENLFGMGVSAASSALQKNGGIDLSGIVGKISLEGTGDPWNGQRMTTEKAAAMTGVTLKAEGGFKPFTLTVIAQ